MNNENERDMNRQEDETEMDSEKAGHSNLGGQDMDEETDMNLNRDSEYRE